MTLKSNFAIVSVLCLGVTATPGLAQPIPALDEARARVACGSGTLVSATRLPGGGVRVTCSQGGTSEAATEAASQASATGGTTGGVLAGTGLAAGPVAGVVAAVGLAALLGGSSSGTTTTTTTTTTSTAPSAGGELR